MAAGNKSVGSTFMERLLHCCTLLGYSLLHCCALLVLVVAVVAPAEWTTINDHGVPVLNEPGVIAGVWTPEVLGVAIGSPALIAQLGSGRATGPRYAIVSMVVWGTAMSLFPLIMYVTSVNGTQWVYYPTAVAFAIAATVVAVIVDAAARKRLYRRRQKEGVKKESPKGGKKKGGGSRRGSHTTDALLPLFVMMITIFL